MRTLVALLGDDSGDAARTIDQLFDYDDERMRAVLSYLTLRVDPAQLKSEAATITEYGWPKPAPGEIVLVALDGDQKTIAAQRIATNECRRRGGHWRGFSEAAQTAGTQCPDLAGRGSKRGETERTPRVGHSGRTAVRPVLSTGPLD